MAQSPSWQARNLSASQGMGYFLRLITVYTAAYHITLHGVALWPFQTENITLP